MSAEPKNLKPADMEHRACAKAYEVAMALMEKALDYTKEGMPGHAAESIGAARCAIDIMRGP